MKGLPLHKVDMRLTKRITLMGSMKVEILAEVFNVFNWKNYGTYNTTITSPSFGQPASNSGNAYVPRSGQLGARILFVSPLASVTGRRERLVALFASVARARSTDHQHQPPFVGGRQEAT